ncbi:MAG: hypothetical protein KDJ17_11475 [Hyphomicrobiaceae bacterium]|nr:hypothetical protein [Hyphomicrobiaceae bacterium]
MTEVASSMWSAVILGAISGLALGLLHLKLLKKTTALYLEGQRTSGALLLTALRLFVAIGVFLALARWSAAATISALIGFSVASWSVLARLRTD